MRVKFIPNEKGSPPGKLADAELHFTEGPLAGLKLIGFAIWERRGRQADREGTANDPSRRIVTFPARSYAVNGERRSYALLRPIGDAASQGGLREVILDAFSQYLESSRIE
jgi:hypothetical protein